MTATKSLALTVTPKLHKLRVVNKIQVKMKNAKNNKFVKWMTNTTWIEPWGGKKHGPIKFSVYMIVYFA